MDDDQFDAFMQTLSGLLTEVVALNTRQVTMNERQEVTNQRLELLILELIRQRRNGNPN